MHAVIFDDDVLTMQGSIQAVEMERNRLVYHGSDFIAYQNLTGHIRKDFENSVRTLCVQIQKLGYRGVIGIDALIVDDKNYVLEANNRFQASSVVVNKTLLDAGLESLQEMNLEAFNLKKGTHMRQNILSEMKIPYSLYAVTDANAGEQSMEILNHEIWNTNIFDEDLLVRLKDGYDERQTIEEGAYLYRMIFRTNIVNIIDGTESRSFTSARLHSSRDEGMVYE